MIRPLFALLAAALALTAGPAFAAETHGFSARGTEWLCETLEGRAQTCCAITPESVRPKEITHQMAVEHCRKMNGLSVEVRRLPSAREWRDENHDYRGCWIEPGKGVRCPEDKTQ